MDNTHEKESVSFFSGSVYLHPFFTIYAELGYHPLFDARIGNRPKKQSRKKRKRKHLKAKRR